MYTGDFSYRGLMIVWGILSICVIAVCIDIFIQEVHTPEQYESSFEVQETMGRQPQYVFLKEQEAELYQFLATQYDTLFGNEFIKACQHETFGEKGYFGLVFSTRGSADTGNYNFHGLPKFYDSVEIYTSSFVGLIKRVVLVYYDNGRVSKIIEGTKDSQLDRAPHVGFRCSGPEDFPDVILR